MKWKGLLFCALALALKCSIANAQSPAFFPGSNEKIYIHFDRSWYSPGETMWFKVYLLHKGFPSLLSNEVFLQLEDIHGNSIDKKQEH